MPSATYCPYSTEAALSHRTLPVLNWMLITSLPDSGTSPTPSQDPHVNNQSKDFNNQSEDFEVSLPVPKPKLDSFRRGSGPDWLG